MILEKFAIFFGKCNIFFFHLFNAKLCAVPLNYYCQALKFSLRRINGGLSDNGCSSVTLASASSPRLFLATSNSHIQKYVILECIDIEMLFLIQIFNRN